MDTLGRAATYANPAMWLPLAIGHGTGHGQETNKLVDKYVGPASLAIGGGALGMALPGMLGGSQAAGIGTSDVLRSGGMQPNYGGLASIGGGGGGINPSQALNLSKLFQGFSGQMESQQSEATALVQAVLNRPPPPATPPRQPIDFRAPGFSVVDHLLRGRGGV